jgi:hypothetical protein
LFSEASSEPGPERTAPPPDPLESAPQRLPSGLSVEDEACSASRPSRTTQSATCTSVPKGRSCASAAFTGRPACALTRPVRWPAPAVPSSVPGRGNVSTSGRGGPRFWSTVSPLVAKRVPEPGSLS